MTFVCEAKEGTNAVETRRDAKIFEFVIESVDGGKNSCEGGGKAAYPLLGSAAPSASCPTLVLADQWDNPPSVLPC